MNDITNTNDPFSQWSRTPTIYVRLPSCGFYNDQQDYKFTQNGEIAISAMTAKDELIFKTPDALLNGDSVARVIESCVPGIKDVYSIPSVDIDVLLLGIRAATYGDDLNFDIICPKCQTENVYTSSINAILSLVKELKSNYQIALSNELLVTLKPYTYASLVKESLQRLNETQILKSLVNDELDEVKNLEHYNKSMDRLIKLVTEINIECLVSIITPEGVNLMDVATAEQTYKWFSDLPKKEADKISKKLKEINDIGIEHEADVMCSNKDCGHKWTTPVSFDPSHFFG